MQIKAHEKKLGVVRTMVIKGKTFNQVRTATKISPKGVVLKTRLDWEEAK